MENIFDKPVILTIGPQQCGTHWIYDYLQGRGDVCLPAHVPEIFYFDRHFQRGPEFYASHFEWKPQHKIVAELTTTAFDNPDAPSHVQKLLGADVKLICPLRHPVDRAIAIYGDYLKYGLVRGGLQDAAEHIPQILLASHYADHLEHWFVQFGMNNIHLLYYEALEDNITLYTSDLCQAMGLDFQSPAAGSLWARLKNKLQPQKNELFLLSPSDTQWLQERLGGEVSRLEKLLKAKIPYWK